MRIAFVSTMGGFAWGGSEELWTSAALEAAQDGHQVSAWIWAWPQPRPQIQQLQKAGVRVVEHPPLSNNYQRKQRFVIRHPNLARRWGHRMSYFRALFRFRPDLVCLNLADIFAPARSFEYGFLTQILTARRIPYVLVCHSCPRIELSPYWTSIMTRVFCDAARACLLSKADRKYVESLIGLPLTNAVFFRNPINLTNAELLPWIENEYVQLANVGRLELQTKGHDLLIRALSSPTWKARRWQLNLFGAGDDKDKIQQEINASQLSDRVTLRGHATDIQSIWAAHHLLVMSSRIEGVPLALVEAMACGRPSVCTNVGGVSEWIDEGVTGFLAHEPSVEAIEQSLETAWAQRENWPEMGQKAHEKALRMIDPNPGRTLVDLLIASATSTPPRDLDSLTSGIG